MRNKWPRVVQIGRHEYEAQRLQEQGKRGDSAVGPDSRCKNRDGAEEGRGKCKNEKEADTKIKAARG